MKNRRAYGAVRVNHVDVQKLAEERPGQEVMIGTDIGKYGLLVCCRWGPRQFERPWRVQNPTQIPDLIERLQQLRQGRRLRVAMEPSGTYGDALRQALHDGQFEVLRVSPKAAHDYAEIFDGVPSQHDGKDAAVVAELAAYDKASLWPFVPASEWEQELAYWVEWLEGQRRILQLWTGRLEGLLARHWPEATRLLKVSSGTLLRVLSEYGGPAALAEDEQALSRVRRWGGKYLSADKAAALVSSAGATAGVRQGKWELRQVCAYAGQARQARQEVQRSKRALLRLAREHTLLQAMGKVVGVPTACVLWVCVGDPRDYHSGPAYRKAMGLNLVERSSGEYESRLHISKRGHPYARQWLYFAAMRLVQKSGVRQWYEAKKAKDDRAGKCALVAVMRKLVLALHQVVVHDETFEAYRLFPGLGRPLPPPCASTSTKRRRRKSRRLQKACSECSKITHQDPQKERA